MISKLQEENIRLMREQADNMEQATQTAVALMRQQADMLEECFRRMDEVDIQKDELIEQQAAYIAELTGSAADDGDYWKSA